MNEKIKENLRDIIAEIIEVEEEEIQDEVSFIEDLKINSMLLLEILASIERYYKIKIPEDELPKLTTLKSTVEVTEKYLN
ncbi:MAG: acyl carrier protein [Spirochaetales bacterium]|nr:acyl carrier protein [Spirochaetales bacterium]